MKTCEIDIIAIEDAIDTLTAIYRLLVNLSEVAEVGATEISSKSLQYLAFQISDQVDAINGAVASALVPPNVAQMPRQAAAN